ncbi:hypothetical protein N7462_002159 [Penicillium macrosclerotiorum]|uniref:uncharacterized protein n=1 Tax=Penicillium macrosclerotiorum TaxID=303699 RepID=UPI0025475E00|nr:uncharacterized protein N7462_002159 [Penicillium macrosclerotiorum]KAJ5692736.1 hypothetical protein N7462_002159 [Penicillium macrosclerotiorum]
MGKKIDDRPAYLSSDDAKYSLGLHRGPLPASGIDENSKLEQVESAGGLSLATTHRTRKEKFARHWKRFWCCYLIGNVIFLAIFLPIFFLVIIPAISQLVVDKSSLVLVNAAVMQPRPDSIKLTLQSALDLKVLLHVRIEPITLDLFVRDTGANNPWATIDLPGMMIVGNTTLGVSDQHTPLINETIWTNYVHDVVFKNESALSVKGSTNSYLGVLKSHVTMDKDIKSQTLGKFAGFSISDSTLLFPSRDDGTNLIGNATLPNPSVLTIEIGTLVLDIKSGDLVIGNATLTDITLKPGNNTYPLTGVLDLKKVLKNLGSVLASQASALKTGNLALDTITRSVVWNGTEVPYYTKVMSELTLTANVPLVSTLKNTLRSLLDNSSSTSSDNSTELSSVLKRNVHLMDAFQDEHPVKRDAMIESLADLYMRA